MLSVEQEGDWAEHTRALLKDSSPELLKDVLQAVQCGNTALTTPTNQFQQLREEVGLIHYDMQNVWECTTAVEGRTSSLKDKIAPAKRNIKANIAVQTYATRTNEIENHLRRNNVHIL